MKYAKPEVTRMGTAIAAVQTAQDKGYGQYTDAPQPGINASDPPAYEADE